MEYDESWRYEVGIASKQLVELDAYLGELAHRLGQEALWRVLYSGGEGKVIVAKSPGMREIHDTPLFRAAEDIVDRVGIRQGALAPDPGDERVPTEDIVSVTEAADALGITRSAVIKAAQAGRIKGKKIGHTWALLHRSVASYRVAQHRVEAGRAAHQ